MAGTLKSRLPMIAAEIRPRVSAAIKAGAEIVAEDAAARAPYGPGIVHIRDHFVVERTGPAKYRVYNDALSETGKYQVPYAYMVEFGTVKNAPRPFLVPAKEAHEDDVLELVRAALEGL